jgi:integrase
MPTVTLSFAQSKFLAWSRLANAPATTKLLEHYLGKFLVHVGDIPLEQISPSDVLSWSSKYHPVESVKRLLAWCHRPARLIPYNPLEGLEKPWRPARRRVLNDAEQAKILRAAGPRFRAFLLALRETIARPQEVRKLCWRHLRADLEMGFKASGLDQNVYFFSLERFKGDIRRRQPYGARVIPISPRLGRLLRRLWGEGKDLDSPVFLNTQGKAWTTNAVRCQMRRLRERCGVKADPSGEKLVCYTLRHTGATRAAAAGVRDFLLAELLGHASVKTTQRYVHLQPAHLREAMGRICGQKRRAPR